jgi:hypothetical protein
VKFKLQNKASLIFQPSKVSTKIYAEYNPHPPASLPKIHSDPILPSTPQSSKWSLSFGLSHQNLVHFLSSPIHATCPAHLIRLDLIFIMIQYIYTIYIYIYIFNQSTPLQILVTLHISVLIGPSAGDAHVKATKTTLTMLTLHAYECQQDLVKVT